MRQFSQNLINKAKKKIKAHFLRLSIDQYILSRDFELFCMEFDIDEIWNEIIKEINKKNHQFGIKEFNKNEIPYRHVDNLFGLFLGTIFDKSPEKFEEIIPEMLWNYSEWNKNTLNAVILDSALVRKIRADCFDFGFDPIEDVDASFALAGFDNYYFTHEDMENTNESNQIFSEEKYQSVIPNEIKESLKKFQDDFPEPKKVGFIMMQFGETQEHTDILTATRKTLAENGLHGVRADDREYHDDKYYNILTYLQGCGFGIAVFEMISEKSFNPNVSLEIGYLLGLNKSVCLLKERKLKTLPSDLVGRLYREFSIENCEISISNQITNWLDDRHLIQPVNNPNELFKKIKNYLVNIAFKNLNIKGDDDYSYAKDIIYSNIEKINPKILEDMKKLSLINSDNSLTIIGKSFIKETLGDYLMDRS
jgi:hypothetical protein